MEYNRAYGDFLQSQSWDYFSTLTYKYDVNENANRKNMDRMVSYINKKVGDYSMFWVAEWHSTRTSIHNHLLFRGDLKRIINAYWTRNRLGDSKGLKHLEYDSTKGASYYISKHIDKQVDYDYVWGK